MNEHKKSTHTNCILPCELCDFVAKSTEEFIKHVDLKHRTKNQSQTKNNTTTSDDNTGGKSYAEKVKGNTSKKKQKTDDVCIPCDMCDFKSLSANDFIRHIETKHQKNTSYACDRCDFAAQS